MEKVRIIYGLEEQQRTHIYAIINMVVANKRLKNTLTNALAATSDNQPHNKKTAGAALNNTGAL